jgi:hypothetical protein
MDRRARLRARIVRLLAEVDDITVEMEELGITPAPRKRRRDLLRVYDGGKATATR